MQAPDQFHGTFEVEDSGLRKDLWWIKLWLFVIVVELAVVVLQGAF